MRLLFSVALVVSGYYRCDPFQKQNSLKRANGRVYPFCLGSGNAKCFSGGIEKKPLWSSFRKCDYEYNIYRKWGGGGIFLKKEKKTDPEVIKLFHAQLS